MAKVLHLTLKKKWFDMIASGDKKEEYRELKKHWITRLLNHNLFTTSRRRNISTEAEAVETILNNTEYFNKNRINNYEYVVFINGYAKDAPTLTIECKGIEIKEGRTEWGAVKGEKYFVIKLGYIHEKGGDT